LAGTDALLNVDTEKLLPAVAALTERVRRS